ncbi:MAG TPA: hypothetical protein VHU82_14010 [Vicinamibacterales bacterium]|nr:hypothetical protein [Vicinamibacterales bacterium]
MSASPQRGRGRPPKFGRPSQVVALTLPDEVVRGLRKVHPDLAWAIVRLFEKRPPTAVEEPQPDAELVAIADRRSLIVVNRAVFKTLPGINIIPLTGHRAILALEPTRGMTDLELAVLDRLDDPRVDPAERKALSRLRTQLRAWRHDRVLRFHSRAIIVVERVHVRRRPRASGAKTSRASSRARS